MESIDNFYLASTEGNRRGQPWVCKFLSRLAWHSRDDLVLVAVTPEISPNVYSTSSKRGALKELVIASRFEGDTLFPISSWPMFVYVCVILNDEFKVTGQAGDKDLSLVDWGVIARSKEELAQWMYKD
jgi:hypothetical protein